MKMKYSATLRAQPNEIKRSQQASYFKDAALDACNNIQLVAPPNRAGSRDEEVAHEAGADTRDHLEVALPNYWEMGSKDSMSSQ